jgi:hypothetical protein
METESDQHFNACVLRTLKRAFILMILFSDFLSLENILPHSQGKGSLSGFVDSVGKATPVKYGKLLVRFMFIRISHYG